MSRFATVLAAAAIIAAVAGIGGQPPAAPDRERAYRSNNLGVALLEQFKHDAAVDAFRQALQIDPSLAIARINLSIALFYLPDLENAAKEAQEAARLLPSAAQPPYILGLIARAESRDEDAIRSFERVRALDPRDVGSAINIGQINLQGRKYAEAAAILRPAVADEPYNVTATYNLGLALTRAGQGEDGQAMMERSQALRATGYGTTLSNTYLEQGRYAEAVASTGAEPDLVDPAVPPAAFTRAAVTGGDQPAGAAAAAPSPFGRSFTADDLTPDGMRRIAAGLGGATTLVDVDGDGHLDLVVVAGGRQRLFRNDGHGAFSDVTAQSGLAAVPGDGVAIGAVAGDVDNDGAPDLFVLRYGASSLYRNDGKGHFSDITARAGLPPYPFLPGAAALVDVDHDGDLDLVIAGLADLAASQRAAAGRTLVFPHDFVAAPLRLLRNSGNATFTDVTLEARLNVATRAVAVAPTDFDNRRDIDLLVVNRDGPPLLFKNLRDGTFRDVAGEVGLAAAAQGNDEIVSVAADDLNKDDYPDFYFVRASGAGLFAMSDGRGRYIMTAAPDETRGTVAAQLVDYDNDGLLDLLAWSDAGPRVFRNLGSRWTDVTRAAVPSAAQVPATLSSARAWAIADVDEDGDSDVVIQQRDGAIDVWHNSGDARNRFIAVRLKGRVSNRSAVASKVQMRAGSLTQRRETSAATPAVAPADVVFGLGRRSGADVVRVLWPSGILQAEYGEGAADPAASRLTSLAALPAALTIEELDRKPSSCPFLYTWNGERFEFVTDFMGGGEMGYWERPGERNNPDPVEYVRIKGDQLRAKAGRYEMRVTNELEETVFVDRVQLLSIAHPAAVEIFPNEGMTDPPKPFRLHAVKDARVPASVVDEHGHDVTARIARIDRQYPDDFELKNIRGYAGDHALTLDLGSPAGAPVLLMTAWTDYAFSSDNVAAHQAGLALAPPSLRIKDAAGGWREAIADIGIPVGRPQTMVVDLAPVLRAGEHQIQIVTNMRIYWDQILVATAVASAPISTRYLDPLTAGLRTRGFSAVLKPDGKEPETYDYDRVTPHSPWKTMVGRYTREGDVRSLVSRTDDMFVIARPGDEIALGFDAEREPPLRSGWTRTFLLMADGFSKEMDINSASPDRVDPLPFHGMTRYPYAAPEHYPTTAAHERYRTDYNTRAVVRDERRTPRDITMMPSRHAPGRRSTPTPPPQ
jgi:Tfp pilus assembly protein PilF